MYKGETSFLCSILKLQRTLIRKTAQQELSSAAVQCDLVCCRKLGQNLGYTGGMAEGGLNLSFPDL